MAQKPSYAAPNLSDLSDLKDEQKVMNPTVKQPTVQVIAAGGCGQNILKAILKCNPQFDAKIDYRVIDTSASNVSGIPQEIPFDAIGELGSGKDRGKNLDAIQKYIDTHPDLFKQASDITFILFSLAGGSGSVIAPLLAHRILRNSNRCVVLVGVVDASSERDCINSINTIRSFASSAEKNGHYFPLMLFNNHGVGRFAVNKTAAQRTIEMIDLLTSKEIEEIDYNDKMHYLRPTTMNCPAGLYLLSVTATNSDQAEDLAGEDDSVIGVGDVLHACMVVNDTGLTPDVLTAFTCVGIAEEKRFFSAIGKTVPQELINFLNETRERYQENTIQKDHSNKDLAGSGNDTAAGLII
jgi:hypothetical protein